MTVINQEIDLDGFVNQVAQNLIKNLKSEHTEVQNIFDHLLKRKGKMFRPSLLYLSTKITSGNIDDALEVATASEMIHIASLVHDDIIDNSEIRRGLPTINSNWGNKIGILIGDNLFADAFTLLTPYEKKEILFTFTQAISKMCQGEIIQLKHAFNPQKSLDTYFKIIEYKTASLLAACCKSGGLISNAPDYQINSLYLFGIHLGRAYQIIDDLLDYLANDKDEKPRGKDLSEGNITLPAIYTLQEKQDLGYEFKNYWNNRDKECYMSILEQITYSNSIKKTLNTAKNEVLYAQQAIKQLPHNKYQDSLFEISNKILKQVNKYSY
ncbi:polyprenyl synthetase family protein [Natranaerobius trueperi]|uniref:Heptaprenyl diphosphate synthase n=1 Tax=Natranaerobius trueperi TaxID=759412 RepID=A0A226BXD8_9FIRM|nr:polyprenyl synthetase family protein [Natranaerobius trueperi]OWZ83581.1 hypothetical protein CDO51_07670 [Natranaerobius trueperi]